MLLLVVPLALSVAAPAFVRLVAPLAHVCHCDRHGGDDVECACPICNPGRADLAGSDEAVRGTCGDDDATLRPIAILPAVLPSTFTLVPFWQWAPRLEDTSRPPLSPSLQPPTPPPRSPDAVA